MSATRAFDEHVVHVGSRATRVVTVMWTPGRKPVQVVKQPALTARQRRQMPTYEAPARAPVTLAETMAELKALGRHDSGNLSWDGVVRGHRFQSLSSTPR